MASFGKNGSLALISNLLLCLLIVGTHSEEARVAILLGQEPGSVHAFRVNNGELFQQLKPAGAWTAVASPAGGKVIANPVAQNGENWGLIVVLAEDGQVYYGVDAGEGVSGWKAVSSVQLPHEANATADINSLTVLRDNTTIHLFAKTAEKNTRLFWARANASSLAAPVFSSWSPVGGDKVALQSAAAPAVNSFTHRVEVVAVMTDGRLYHTWQTSETSFHDWDSFADWFGTHHPEPDAAPLLRSNSGKSIFNGRLEMFVLGTDGYIHHMAQTTCDGVMNPWSQCTWGFYERLEKHAVPTALSKRYPLVVGGNAHGGIEIFTVDKSFRFWHLWQVEEGKSYHTWQEVESSACHSSPTIVQDATGYWMAFALDESSSVQEIKQSRAMALNPAKGPLSSGSNVTVSWSVPEDEATNADWIGIYKHGDTNDRYVDFAYVQGLQNPLHEAIPVGNFTRHSVLGNGDYDYRYLVNRKFVNIMQQTLSFFNYTKDDEGTQLYHGMAVGLGKEAGAFDECVEDGNHTVQVFRQAFTAFEDREIVKGLQLFGTGLKDLSAAVAECEHTDIAKAIERFIKDLVSCTKGSCAKFIIDVLGELVSVLYENVHEIYGDIRGAQNCFKYDLYEQGGINIGRVVAACIEGPDVLH